ncbi:MAG: hypothetical protein QOC82_364 [Frankiaceae bacterium]|nr:hypothetical protein [Frankiaceae bacterium]MDQ1700488.1 hypothetical protein [Frankiaceae bacterium]
MNQLARVNDAERLDGFAVRLTFTDGLVRELDLEPLLTDGVLAALRDAEVFASLHVDPIAGTIAWTNGVDLDPDVLHGDHEPAQGPGPRLLNEYRLRPSA